MFITIPLNDGQRKTKGLHSKEKNESMFGLSTKAM